MTLNETVETTSGSEEGSSEEQMKKIGFVLAEEGDDDYISVHIRKEQGASSGTNFVYYTQGGATACPYEGEETTRYYEPGRHKLSEGTLRIEVPKIDAEVTTISNVPSDKAAVFKLLLSNDSEAQEDVIYTLKMDDASNNTGAKFTIDGVPLSTGRDFVVPEDVLYLAAPVLRHRVQLSAEKELEGVVVDQVIQQLIAKVEIPR